jgi:topoisomerase IA-like protein
LLAGGQLTDKRVLVVLSEMADNVVRSLRNLDNVLTVSATQVSILEVAMADAIIISTKAIGVLESRLLASEKEAKKTPKAESAAKTEVAKKATPAKTVKKEAAPKTTKKVTKKS